MDEHEQAKMIVEELRHAPHIRDTDFVRMANLAPDTPNGAILKLMVMVYDLVQRGVFVIKEDK